MRTDLRRSKRYNEFIAVSVLARNKTNNVHEAGPCTGRIINISRHGACILMPLGILGAYDIYRSTGIEDGLLLDIKGNTPPGRGFVLSGTPVWMNPFVLDDLHAFKMGVEFTAETIASESDGLIRDLHTAQHGDMSEAVG